MLFHEVTTVCYHQISSYWVVQKLLYTNCHVQKLLYTFQFACACAWTAVYRLYTKCRSRLCKCALVLWLVLCSVTYKNECFPNIALFLYTFISFTFQVLIRYRSFCSGRTPRALIKTIKYSNYWIILGITGKNHSKFQIILVIPGCKLTLNLTLPYFFYLTLPYVLPYHTIPYVLPHLTLPYVLPYITVPYVLPYLTSYLTVHYLTLPYLTSYLTLP